MIRNKKKVVKKWQYRINEDIRVKEVRLVGDNIEQGVVPTYKALSLARQAELDLVEISPNANPPVCKIIDYQKFLYQMKKKQKEQKANTVKVQVKEIRFGPHTDAHDYNFKLKHAQEFLKDGHKVKAYVFFRGRSILFKEQGIELLLRFANDLEEYGRIESMPVLEGKRMIVFLSPLKKAVVTKQKKKVNSKKEKVSKESNKASKKDVDTSTESTITSKEETKKTSTEETSVKE